MTQKKDTVVMAGNPKVEMTEDGRIELDPQLMAFTETMKLVSEVRERIVRIYITFDHVGIFSDQFVKHGVSAKDSRKPTLATLKTEISEVFRPIAEAHAVGLQDIHVITEAQCRMQMLRMLQDGNVPDHIKPYVSQKSVPLCSTGSCGLKAVVSDDEEDEKIRITCKGITAEIVRRLAAHGENIEMFWELNPVRCKPFTLIGGTDIARQLFKIGEEYKITHHMLTERNGWLSNKHNKKK